jgi:hypothetical protein
MKPSGLPLSFTGKQLIISLTAWITSTSEIGTSCLQLGMIPHGKSTMNAFTKPL